VLDVAGGLPPLFADLGLWIGLGLSLALFSLLLGDNVVARLAQHILVGAAMGFLAVVVIQHIAVPRLVEPLLRGEWTTHAAPLLLALVLLAAGTERIVRQSRQPQGSAPSDAAKGRGGCWLLCPLPCCWEPALPWVWQALCRVRSGRRRARCCWAHGPTGAQAAPSGMAR